MEVDPPRPDATDVDLPTVLMLHVPLSFFWNGRSDPAMFRWMATIQPGYREAWSAIGALLIARNVDWWSAEWANRAFLEPFLEPFAPIGPHARTLLGLALGQKEAGERGLATDVVRQAVADGRLDAAGLADGLTATVALECDRPNRWALSLAEVAAHSDANARVVAEAIGRTLPALAERPPAKLVPLLRLLDELLAGDGQLRRSMTLARPWSSSVGHPARPAAWPDRSWPAPDQTARNGVSAHRFVGTSLVRMPRALDPMVHSATPAHDHAERLSMRRRLTASLVMCAVVALALAPATSATKPRATGSTGTATVFFPNPVAQLQNQSLTDQKDADYAALQPAYHGVTLTNLDGSGFLVGDWANVRAETGTRRTRRPTPSTTTATTTDSSR